MTQQEKFYEVIKENNIELFKTLLKDNEVDPSCNSNYAIRIACHKGYYDIAKILLSDKRVDPSNRFVIRASSENGNCDILQLLLNDNRIDPTNDYNWAIRLAKLNKHYDVVNLLWNDKRVKESLKDDDEQLYNELKSLDIQKNIGNFHD